MKELAFVNAAPVYIEISPSVLRVLRQEEGLEIPLQRSENGRLTGLCKEQASSLLRGFLRRKAWQPRIRALCAVGASGVALRRIAVPACAPDELRKVLLLQIENEFPVSPGDLAWGFCRVGELLKDGGADRQELLVAAVRKEIIEDYSAVFSPAGASPVFTLAALARSSLCPQPLGTCALLDIGASQSELVFFEKGFPASARLIPWGVENILKSGAGLNAMVQALLAQRVAGVLYIGGAYDGVKNLATQLARLLPETVQCRSLEISTATGRSAATVGLKKSDEDNGKGPALVFHTSARPVNGPLRLTDPAPKKWLRAAAILLGLILILPYAEALLLKPFLARKISKLNAQKGRLSTIDREMSFLQYLDRTQPPYLDALYVFAKSAPPGSKIESLSMNRRGEISLRGSLGNAQQVVEFRSRLIDTGLFSTVALEEQSPTPDRQKVRVRISAQWKPPEARAALAIGPRPDEIEKAKMIKPAAGPASASPNAPAPAMPSGPQPRKL